MTSHEAAELISLGLTPQAIISAVAVVVLWAPAAYRALIKRQKSAQDWFIIGVTVGFVGQVMDNGYWSIPWTASYLQLPAAEALFSAGVYFNIVFRQSMGIAAAYCHLRAAQESNKSAGAWVNWLFAIANVCGVGYAVVLIVIRGMG